jgi:murein DD-endopeptidase MepM/ murein hydrolase activator NlpD
MRLNVIAFPALIALLSCAPDVMATPAPKLSLKWPVCTGWSGGYGWKVDPFTGYPTFHKGLDMAGDYGTIVRAAAGGRVTLADQQGPYGLTIETDGGDGVRLRYGHFKKLLVKKGDVIKAGDRIGLMGSSGRSTGPHLCFQVWIGDKAHNPLHYLKRNARCAGTRD